MNNKEIEKFRYTLKEASLQPKRSRWNFTKLYKKTDIDKRNYL